MLKKINVCRPYKNICNKWKLKFENGDYPEIEHTYYITNLLRTLITIECLKFATKVLRSYRGLFDNLNNEKI